MCHRFRPSLVVPLMMLLAAGTVASAAEWARGSAIRVAVDPTTFAYSARLGATHLHHLHLVKAEAGPTHLADAHAGGSSSGDACSLLAGSVAFVCKGEAHRVGAGLSMVSTPQAIVGTDTRLGNYDAIAATWRGGTDSDCDVRTEIRYFAAIDSFVFVAAFAPEGVRGTNTTAPKGDGVGWRAATAPDLALSTAFPYFSAAHIGSSCSYLSYEGNSLGRNFRSGALEAWSGGIEGGPLLLYPSNSTQNHPPAAILSPLTHAKAMMGSGFGTDGTVAFGVQGYVEELPADFKTSVVLVGRPGIAATQMAWGAAITAHAGTTRLSLADDILNSKVTYWTDNGAYYCYCNTYRQTPDRRVPMHIIIKNLTEYHRSLGLHIDMYHLDSGFWHSAHKDGHCDGVTASNWSASEFHWPHTAGPDGRIGDGLSSKVWGSPGEPGAVSWQMLYMLLAGSKDVVAWPGNEAGHGNVYATTSGAQGGPWPMQDDTFGGQKTGQVRSHAAHAFWDAVIGYGYRENNLRAMVIDTLQVYFEEFHDRLNNTHRHEEWMDGYLGPSGGAGPGGASKYGLPVRIDQCLPSDHLASAVLNWPAVVSARIGGDMDGGNTWTQMAQSGAFLSALLIRPIMDVLWTDPIQPDNTEHLSFRANTEHELIIAVLTCGPVGFGDSLPRPGFAGTNVTRLLLASRKDGVILKPAHTALPLDIESSGQLDSQAHVWAAPSVPARPGANPRTDKRANSFARLLATDGTAERPGMHWWYTLLATDINSKPKEPVCAAPPVGKAGIVGVFDCSESSEGIRLHPDGSLRASNDACVSATIDRGNLTVHPVIDGCSRFELSTQDGSLRPRDAMKMCVAETQDSSLTKLTLKPCESSATNVRSAALQRWTTVNSITGQWLEPASHHSMQFIEQPGGKVFITFDGDAWQTANCTLLDRDEVGLCVGGHFSGGPIGKDFPSCIWNASVQMPQFTVEATSAGCTTCCKGTVWRKESYAADDTRLQNFHSGKCPRSCNDQSSPPPPLGMTMYPESLFPTPAADATFVVRTFGITCVHGAPASSCLVPLSASTPLALTTPLRSPKQTSRNWRIYGVAPVLIGGWVLIGEENKYVALSPQRFVAAAPAFPNRAQDSDALFDEELMADGNGLRFTIIGSDKEDVRVTIVVPTSLTNATIGDRVLEQAAMGGKIVVLDVTLDNSGKAGVVCSKSGCTTD